MAISLVHSKLDYCNSLYLGLSKTELGRLQLIENVLGHVVANTKRHEHITHILQSLHWFKIQERITCKTVSVTYDVLGKAIISLQSPYHSASLLHQIFETHHSTVLQSHSLVLSCCRRPEAACDVISSVAVEHVRMDVHVKMGDFWSNRSRDIRAVQSVMDEERTTADGPCGNRS